MSRGYYHYSDMRGTPAPIEIEAHVTKAAPHQWFTVRLVGDAMLDFSPERLAELGSKIDAALAGIRGSLNADPEIAESLDAVRMTAELEGAPC